VTNLVYEFLRVVLHTVLRVFYRKIEIAGAELVPRGRPLIFVANHVNGIVDPLLIAMVTQRPMQFMAKAPLFQTWMFGPLLKLVDAIPVFRRDPRDYPGGIVPQDLPHDEMFRAAHDRLAAGGNLCLFPEGVGHSYPQMQELKTGVARILLGAEAAHQYALDIHIVPVGLTFENQGLFRSKVFIRVGPALAGRGYFEQHRAEPIEAARRLTEDLQQALRAVTLNFETQAEKDFFLTAAEVLHGRRLLNEKLLQVVKEWTPVYRHFKDQQPEVLEAYRVRLSDYADLKDALSLQERVVTLLASFGAPARLILRMLPLALAAVFVVPMGIAVNLLPYLFCAEIARRREHLDERASAQIVAGFVSYPPMYLVWAILVGWWSGSWILAFATPLYAAGLGVLTVWTVALFAHDWEALKSWLFFRTNPKLQSFLLRKRHELLDQLEAARAAASAAPGIPVAPATIPPVTPGPDGAGPAAPAILAGTPPLAAETAAPSKASSASPAI